DYFTDEELELVRDAQDIDLRIKVLTHAIDRRLAILNIGPAATGKELKESDNWGPPPTGSRSQLLSDIKRILQKAVDDIDDTSAHAGTTMARTPENPTKKDKLDPPFARALRELDTAAKRYKPLFQAELDKSTNAKDNGPVLDAIDLCDQIVEGISKAQAPVKN
ncbi:MAG: hypothetical protein ABJA02_03355, partial [Acidobacteriota bacterium]